MTRNSSMKSVKSDSSLDKRVRFQSVNVFYFARTQGMSTVPKSGEVSLGKKSLLVQQKDSYGGNFRNGG